MPTVPQQPAPTPSGPPPSPAGEPQPQQAQAKPVKPDKLHNLAINAEKNLEQLATELAHTGADQQTVGVVTKMADVARKIAVAITKGQGQADNQPAGPEPSAPPAGEAAPQPTQHTMGSATNSMQDDLKRQRQSQGGSY